MDNIIKIVYIDDDLQDQITEYLDEHYIHPKIEISTSYFKFEEDNSYENLLDEKKIQEANILLIDSGLFLNTTISNQKFTGEEFTLILKKIYPYINVIVITQNSKSDYTDFKVVEKYKTAHNTQPKEYYDENLKLELDYCVEKILEYRGLLAKIQKNTSIDTYLAEQIENSLAGVNTYDALKKDDIDNLVKAIQQLEENIND